MKHYLAVFVVIMLGVVYWFSQSENWEDSNPSRLNERIANHEIRQYRFWKPFFGEEMLKRIHPAPPAVLDFIGLDNRLNGYPHHPIAVAHAEPFAAKVLEALEELPAAILSKLQPKLGAIFLVENLGGTGFTDVIYDENGLGFGGFIVLDVSALNKTANEWATWKENTPFRSSEEVMITATIEAAANDSQVNAIQFILLHEIGHVLAIGGDIHPPWNALLKKEPFHRYPFSQFSWQESGSSNAYISKFDDTFTRRKEVRFYFGAELEARDAIGIYKDLEATNFPTLYAATSIYDDFAESFATYVHSVMLYKPYRISIQDSRTGRTHVYSSCWEEERCSAKRNALSSFLSSQDN